MDTASTTNRKRLIQIKPANLRNNHIYVKDHLDFFPADVVGPAKRTKKATHAGNEIQISLSGLDRTITTDVGRDPSTNRPRSFLRDRQWIGRFFEHHKIEAGDWLALERLEERHYLLSVESSAPRFAEFFAGIGLVRLALEPQWKAVFANDIDPDKAEMYRHNWPTDDHLAVKDIHKIDVAEIPDCHLFTASFPCNDLSIAGRWDGLNGKESSAFWGLIRILQEMNERRPALVMLENVVGFLMSNGGRDFEKALLALNEVGYNVDAFILNAIHWRPQSRARLFVIGKLDQGRPRQTHPIVSVVRPEPLFQFIFVHDNIRWDLRSLPNPPTASMRLSDIVEDLPDSDPHWWDDDRTSYFMNQLSPKHLAEANEMIARSIVSYATAFRRVRNEKSMAELRTDGIAGCLRTPRGGSGRQILFKAGRGRHQVRLLTARECARLQGVPDQYKINVGLNKALFGFGDAVCVPAVRWIRDNYLNPEVAAASSVDPT